MESQVASFDSIECVYVCNKREVCEFVEKERRSDKARGETEMKGKLAGGKGASARGGPSE